MSDIKIIAVPIDGNGMFDYENDISKRDKLKIFNFPENEFDYMWDNKLFEIMNDRFDLLIDDYEEEIIPNKYLFDVKDIIEKHIKNIPCFYKALLFAIQCNTELCLEF